MWTGIGEDRCVAIPAYELGRTSEGGGGGEGVGVEFHHRPLEG